jgi:cytochrome c
MALRNTLLLAGVVVAVIVIGLVGLVLLRDDDGEPTASDATSPQPGTSVVQEPARPTATQPEAGDPASAPSPPAEGLFGFGQAADDELVAEWDIDIPPDGSGLPDGSGTAGEGAEVYAAECAACHGETGREGGLGPVLVSEPGPWEPGMPRTIGSYWPYATTVYDYVHRAMPFDHPGSLDPDQVYAVTAYLLAENGVIAEDQEMNAETLPQVEMPNQPNFFPCWPEECR